MYCPTCGHNATNKTRFCAHCGTPLDAAETAPIEAEQTQNRMPTAEQPAASQQATPEQGVRQSFAYITSYLTFYLKGSVDVEADRISLNIPNTILGFIPLGSQKRTLDIKHITEVGSDFHISFFALVIGLLLTPAAPLGITSIGSGHAMGGVFTLLIGLWGISLALNAITTTVSISLSSSERIVLNIVFFEKAQAEAIADAINRALLLRTRDTNFRVHTDRSMGHTAYQTDRIIDAINRSNS